MPASKTPTPLSQIPASEGVAYKPLPSGGGYAVGTDGSVWTSRVAGPNGPWFGPWRRMKTDIHRDGYEWVEIRVGGEPKKRQVHALVLETFVGPKPPGMEARHYPDPTRTNNCLSNLRWGTKSQNCLDRSEHGSLVGETHGSHKLTAAQVAEIRRRFDGKVATKRLMASEFNVFVSTIDKIVYRKTWRHLPKEVTE